MPLEKQNWDRWARGLSGLLAQGRFHSLENSFLQRVGGLDSQLPALLIPRNTQATDVHGSQSCELTTCAFWISMCKHGDSLFRKKKEKGGKGGEEKSPCKGKM